MIGNLLGYPSKLKKFEQSVFVKKKEKSTPPALEELVLQCTNPDASKRPTFSIIATKLIEMHNQLYPTLPPLTDEEATFAMDVATNGVRARRTSSARKSKHRSLELKSPVSVGGGRQRGRVVLEAPNLSLMNST